jgi:hypothetical protein
MTIIFFKFYIFMKFLKNFILLNKNLFNYYQNIELPNCRNKKKKFLKRKFILLKNFLDFQLIELKFFFFKVLLNKL